MPSTSKLSKLWNGLPRTVIESQPKGACDAEIARLQRSLGVSFPTGFAAYLGLSNGSRGLFRSAWDLMSVDEVEETWDMLNQVVRLRLESGEETKVLPEGPCRAHWWSDRWIPIAKNGKGDFICLDFDPAEQGTDAQVVLYLHDKPIRKVLAPTFVDWLAESLQVS